MKSPKHNAIVAMLKSPSMVGGIQRFSPDAMATAMALCESIRAKPASNRFLLNELWETEYRPVIQAHLKAIRQEAFVDVVLVEELARQIMVSRSNAHITPLFSSYYTINQSMELCKDGEIDCGEIFNLLERSDLGMGADEREIAIASGRMASEVNNMRKRLDQLPFPENTRRSVINETTRLAGYILEIESGWWSMVERFTPCHSAAARDFIDGIFTRTDEDDKVKVVLDEAFKRAAQLSPDQTVDEKPELRLAMEAFYVS